MEQPNVTVYREQARLTFKNGCMALLRIWDHLQLTHYKIKIYLDDHGTPFMPCPENGFRRYHDSTASDVTREKFAQSSGHRGKMKEGCEGLWGILQKALFYKLLTLEEVKKIVADLRFQYPTTTKGKFLLRGFKANG